jgi:hypothetical protein
MVVSSAVLSPLFNLSAMNQALFAQTAKDRIKRPDAKLNALLRRLLNEFADFVSIMRAPPTEKNQQFSTALLEF